MDDQKAIQLLENNRVFMPIINSNIELKEYMQHRYNDIPSDKFSYKEIRYRLLNNIEIRPTCRVCGKPVNFIGNESLNVCGKTLNGYRKTCSQSCHFNDKESYIKYKETKQNRTDEEKNLERLKREQTCLERYGARSIFIVKKDKIKQTMLERYGGYTLESKVLKEKQQETVEKLYGAKNIRCTEYGKEKIKETQRLKNNGLLYCQTDEARKQQSINAKKAIEKTVATNLERYGCKSVMNVPEFVEKRRQTIKQRQTYKSSIEENDLYNILLAIFGNDDIERFYKEERYPFDCDFYVKSLDLFIEYHGSQYHHWYQYKGDIIDKIYLFIYEQKEYLGNIDVWTKRDVSKMELSINNKINYLVLYPGWHINWKTYTKTKKYKHLYVDKIREQLKNICLSTNGINVIGELNKYEALYKYLNWETYGIANGYIVDKSNNSFIYNGQPIYYILDETSDNVIIRHLGRMIPVNKVFTDEIFTQEFLTFIYNNITRFGIKKC